MALFNNLFKSNDDNYVDLENFKQAENVEKSFTKGRSDSKPSVVGLDIAGINAPQEHNGEMPKNYYIRQKRISYAFATGNIVAQAIIRTRTSQVRKFAIPARNTADGVGYKIVAKDGSGSKLSKTQKKRIRQLEDFIYNTGKEYVDYRDDFSAFLTKFVFNYYTYDQINIERLFESSTSSKLNHFNMVDAGTIVIHKYPNSIDTKPEYAQVIDDKIKHKFSPRNLTFVTYWNTGDIHNFGYGFSPVQASMEHLGYFNDTEQFNARFFKQGGTTRGLLVINAGDNQYSQVALESLRRTWTSMKGINGAWKIPVMTAADAKFVNMTQSSKDMEFSEWINFLINMLSGVFQINPEEINIPNRGGATGKTGGATFESKGSSKDRNQVSKEKGLTPLLRFIESVINDKILRYVDNDYHFEFTLGDSGEEQKQQEILHSKLENGMFLNDAREQMGLSRKPGLDVPGDANNWVQLQGVMSKQDKEVNYVEQHKNDGQPGKEDAPEFDPKEPNKSDSDNENSNKSQPNDNTKQ